MGACRPSSVLYYICTCVVKGVDLSEIMNAIIQEERLVLNTGILRSFRLQI